MIKDIKELNFPQYATLETATATIADMGDRTITSQVKIEGDVVPDFSYDWEVEFKGERYIHPIRKPQGMKENTSMSAKIDMVFQHWAIYEMKRQYFIEMSSTSAGVAVADKYIASLGLNLGDFVVAFNLVLNHYFGDRIAIRLNPNWQYDREAKFVSISYSYIWDVLQQIHEIYGVRWTLKTNAEGVCEILMGYPAEEVSHIFEYGFEGGLLSVQRQVQSTDIRNRILGRGGETNLPLRYFKDKDPNNPLFEADPDWIPELANIAFTELRGKTFRDYVKGWKAKHYGGTVMAEPTEAYLAGYNAEKFDPVEYVEDKESIAKYGVLVGALENNEDIYPSIQGAPNDVDAIVDAEQVTDDDVDSAVENDSVTTNLESGYQTYRNAPANSTVTIETLTKRYFSVPEGKVGNLSMSLTATGKYSYFGDYEETHPILKADTVKVTIHDKITGAEVKSSSVPVVDIPAGDYYYMISADVETNYDRTSMVTLNIESVYLYTSTPNKSEGWKQTFDIWVRNIWGSTRSDGETDQQYADRVWTPILGDRMGGEARVVFTSGWLSFSSDWEFPIVGYAYDDSKEGSHWRLTLAKSEAELEASGKYIPYEGYNASAGDRFFFIGIDMPYEYVIWAEERLDDFKRDSLMQTAEVNPAWVIKTDKVRLNQDREGVVLVDSLNAGSQIRLASKQFISGAYETLYVQSLTYKWTADTIMYPDVEVVVSDKAVVVKNPVAQIQSNIESIQRQVGSLSNIQQIIRQVCDKLYLRKDGFSDISKSPTRFLGKISGENFRPGQIGGRDWGIYRDENGNAILEADKFVARQGILVNELIVSEATYVGGLQINSAASMNITVVEETEDGYVCFFDQKQGTVTNKFVVDDVVLCQRFDADQTVVKFYKARVTAVSEDSVTLSKTEVNGTGIPAVDDAIIQYGNYSDKTRQYVIVRDVIGGGYERMLMGLDSVESDGVEYYFAGKSADSTARWFVGGTEQFAEYKDGQLTIKGNIFVTGSDKNISEQLAQIDFIREAFGENAQGLVLGTAIIVGYTDENENFVPMAGLSGVYDKDVENGGPAAWYGGTPDDAKSVIFMDGTGYFADGLFRWDKDKGVNLGNGAIKINYDGSVEFGGDIKIGGTGEETLDSLLTAVATLFDIWKIDEETGNLVTERNVVIKKNLTVYEDMSSGSDGDPSTNTGLNKEELQEYLDENKYVTETRVQEMIDEVTAGDVELTNYYTKKEVDDLVDPLRKDVEDIAAVLGIDEEAEGYINTWAEVKAFLDGYQNSDDLAVILSGINAEVAKNATAILGLDERLKVEEDVTETYSQWWADLKKHVLVNAEDDVTIDTDLIVSGDVASGDDGQGTAASGTVTGVIVGSDKYEDVSSGLLDLTEAFNKIDVSDQLSDYLLKSGGIIYNEKASTPLYIKSPNKSVFIGFTDEEENPLGFIGFTDANSPKFCKSNGTTTYDLIHGGNIENQLVKGLAKSVTIWGQSFDGTNNVVGALYMGGDQGIFLNKDEEGIYFSGTGVNWHNASNIWTKSIMRFNASGNVTIGAEDKAKTNVKLYVDGGASLYGALNVYQPSTTLRANFNMQDGVAKAYGWDETERHWTDMWIGNNQGEALVIKAGGNVGIGTTDPKYKLDVDGTARIRQNIYATNAIVMNTDAEGVYYAYNGINWHDSNNSYVASLIGFAKNSITLNQPVTASSTLSVGGKITLTSWDSDGTAIRLEGGNMGKGLISVYAAGGNAYTFGQDSTKFIISHNAGGTIFELNGNTKKTNITGDFVVSGDVSSGGGGTSTDAVGTITGVKVNSAVYGDDYITAGILDLTDAFNAIDVSDQLANYLPLSGGTMAKDAYISWNTTSEGNDVADWDTVTGRGLRIISSASATSNAPDQYSTALHVKGRYGFQLAVKGGTSPSFYIRSAQSGANTWREIFHSGNYSDLITGTLGVDITGNAATATKLADNTAFTAWGQTFFENGQPKNVSGNISLSNGIIYGAGSRNAFQTSGTDLYLGSGYTASGDRTFIHGNVIRMYTGTGSQSVFINSSGNVTIGGSDLAGASAKLLVDGALKVISPNDYTSYGFNTTIKQTTISFQGDSSKYTSGWQGGINCGYDGEVASYLCGVYFGGNAPSFHWYGGTRDSFGLKINVESKAADFSSSVAVAGIFTAKSSIRLSTVDTSIFFNSASSGVYMHGGGINWHEKASYKKSLIGFTSENVTIHQALTVSGGSTFHNVAVLYKANATSGKRLTFNMPDDIARIYNYDDSNPSFCDMYIGANGTDAIVISNGSRVGIGGAANSNYKLHVKGNSYTEGNLVVSGDVSSGGSGTTTDAVGTVTGIKVNGQTYSPASGIVTIPDYPTSLTWSAISGKPTKLSDFTDDVVKNHYLPTAGNVSITRSDRYHLSLDNNLSDGSSGLWFNNERDYSNGGAVLQHNKKTGTFTLTNFDSYNNKTTGIGAIAITKDNRAVVGDVNLTAGYTFDIVHTGNISKYALPIGGGELKGGLTIKSGNFIVESGHTVVGWLYPTADNGSSLGQGTRRWSNVYTMLINGGTPIHANNYSSYALPKAGGTLEGNLFINPSDVSDASVVFQINKLGDGSYDYKVGKFTDVDSKAGFGMAMNKSDGTWKKFFGISWDGAYNVTSVDILTTLTVENDILSKDSVKMVTMGVSGGNRYVNLGDYSSSTYATYVNINANKLTRFIDASGKEIAALNHQNGALTLTSDIYLTKQDGIIRFNSGATGVYMHGGGINWHNAAGTYVSSLIGFAQSELTLHQPVTTKKGAKFSNSTRYALQIASETTSALISFKGTGNNESAQFGAGANDELYAFNYAAYRNNSNSITAYGIDASGNFYFGTGGSPSLSNSKAVLLANGNMGLGLSNPSHKLHVSGDIVATGDVSTGGGSTSGSSAGPVYINVDAIWDGGYRTQVSQSVMDGYGLTVEVINNMLNGVYTKVINSSSQDVWDYSGWKSGNNYYIFLRQGDGFDTENGISLRYYNSTWTINIGEI